MPSEEDKKGALASAAEDPPAGDGLAGTPAADSGARIENNEVETTGDADAAYPEGSSASYTPKVDDAYGDYEDPYAYTNQSASQAGNSTDIVPALPPPPLPPKPDLEEGDSDDHGMLRMSFLEHLEELRSRLIKVVAGFGVAFIISLTFAERLWLIVQQPASAALKQLGFSPNLVMSTPMDGFAIIYMKMPILTSIFIASPWVLYQVWSFIAPGLYKRERRFAVPFVVVSAGLFIAGGLFAYFVAFRFGLTFLLGIGRGLNLTPLITITAYFDLFVNVILGIGVVFELPVLIFFLTLLRIASPKFLLANSRYAILAIVLLAAIVTPTPDIFNLMIFTVPMVLLYFVGLFASYLLVLQRENRRFPWRTTLFALGIPILLIGAALYIAVAKYSYKLVLSWPFLVR